MIVALQSCGSKKSTYKSAYEQAQQREQTTDDFSDEFGTEEPSEIAPVNKPREDNGGIDEMGSEEEGGNYEDNYDDYNPIQENVYPYEDNSSNANVQVSFNLKRYNVVIGSYRNGTNANAIKERMQRDGYVVDFVRNDRGLIRVIVKTTDNKNEALQERIRIRSRYYPNFQDTWVLKRY
jgi:cell division protein FtsN